MTFVVEDDPTTGAYIAEGLREEGHVADLVDDGREGLIAAQTRDYDVLVLDRRQSFTMVIELSISCSSAIYSSGPDNEHNLR